MSSIFGVSRRGLAGFGFLTLRRRPALGIPKIGELRHAGKGLFREAETNAQWAAPFTVWITVFALWSKGGHFFATGDVTPWVRNGLRAEIGSLWTHQNTGAGGTTYEIGRVVELLFIRLGELLGGGAPLGQRLFFASIFAFAAYGGSLFGRRMGRRSATVFLSGLLAAFNPYFLFYLPNICR